MVESSKRAHEKKEKKKRVVDAHLSTYVSHVPMPESTENTFVIIVFVCIKTTMSHMGGVSYDTTSHKNNSPTPSFSSLTPN